MTQRRLVLACVTTLLATVVACWPAVLCHGRRPRRRGPGRESGSLQREPVARVHVQERRPVQDAGARLDHRRPEWSTQRASLHVLRGDLDWRRVQDHQRRRDVHASVRSSEQADDRRRRHRAVEFQDRLGRNGRHARRPQLVPGDGIYKSEDAGETWTNMGLHDSHHISRVVIHPTNPDLVYVGVMGHLYSRQRGARRLQEHGRRQDLEAIVLRQRQARRDRSRHESAEAGRSLRRDVRQAADAVDESERRTRQRHLQDRGWRRYLDEAHERTAHGPHRQDRARYLREESGDPLRGAHQRQPGRLAWHAWRMHGRPASRARGRRDVSHRQRRRELEKSQFRRG